MFKIVGFRKIELLSLAIAGSSPLEKKVLKAIQIATEGLGFVSARRFHTREGMRA